MPMVNKATYLVAVWRSSKDNRTLSWYGRCTTRSYFSEENERYEPPEEHCSIVGPFLVSAIRHPRIVQG